MQHNLTGKNINIGPQNPMLAVNQVLFEDERMYDPETPPPSSSGLPSDQSIDETLEALGYKF